MTVLTKPRSIWVVAHVAVAATLLPSYTAAQATGTRLTLRIGSDSSPDYLLTAVGGLAIRSDGAIFVLQPQDAAVRAYSKDGQHLFDFGRRGDGPGDFRYIRAAGWLGDAIWVSDLRGRVSMFDADGRYLGSSSIDKPVTQLAPLATGYLIASEGVSAERVARGLQSTIPLFRWSAQTRGADTVRMLDVTGSTWRISNPAIREGPVTFRTQPFDESTLWSTTPNGTSIVIVDRRVGTRTMFRVTKLDSSGDTLFSKEVSYRPLPIESRFVDSVVDSEAQRAVTSRMFPTLDAARREVLRSFHRPAHQPPVAQLIVGLDGSIWLRNPGPMRGAKWRVIATNGRELGEIATPHGFRLHAAQLGTIWGTEQDELGVESVVRYQIGPSRRR